MWRIGFLGCGQMATALITGIIQSKLADPTELCGYDPAGAQSLLQLGGDACTSNVQVVQGSEIIFLCVKPQVADSVLKEIAPYMTADKLFVSIAAGVSIDRIYRNLSSNEALKIIRVMPNTPCLVQAGASAYAKGSNVSEQDAKPVQEILSAVGICFELKESLLDAVTGLSGSGPAFVFMMIEAMADGGVKAGLPRNIALKLAAQTVFGSAKLLMESGKHPGELKDMVASPAGTTIAGISVLENRGIRGSFIDAVKAAADRSTELGSKQN
jgi:pyrroline-5-carboxylate reductase